MIAVQSEWIQCGFYWLRIEGGGEHRSIMDELERRAPWGRPKELAPALAVEVINADGDLFEQTTTINRRFSEGPAYGWRSVRPPGEDWEMFDGSADKWTVWRRRIEAWA
jgi:hypothetical protein